MKSSKKWKKFVEKIKDKAKRDSLKNMAHESWKLGYKFRATMQNIKTN